MTTNTPEIASSIQLKTLILIAMPILLVTVAMLWINPSSDKEESSELLKSFYLLEAKQKSEVISSQLHGLQEMVSMMERFLSKNTDINQKQVEDLIHGVIEASPLAFGSAIAFEPYSFDSQTKLYSPYAYRSDAGISLLDIGHITDTSGYDYTDGQWEWWSWAKDANAGIWTAPYFDEGAGNALMSTYSVPFYNKSQFRGVVTVDILLESIFSQMGLTSPDEFIVSAEGNIIFSNNEEDLLTNTLTELDRNEGHTNLNALLDLAATEANGLYTFHNEIGESIWGVFNSIPQTGWVYIHLLSEKNALKSSPNSYEP